MRISDLAKANAAKFVSIYDLVTHTARKDNISTSNAAIALIHLLNGEEKQWRYVYRSDVNFLISEVVAFNDTCLLELKKIANREPIETNIDEHVACNTGWRKSEILGVFKKHDLEILPCLEDDHISPTSFLGPFDETFPNIKSCSGDGKHIVPEYLDNEHPCYSPKLALAIKLWILVAETYGKNRLTPTRITLNWLDRNLDNLDFKLGKKAITSLVNVVNFRTKNASVSEAELLDLAQKMSAYQQKRNL